MLHGTVVRLHDQGSVADAEVSPGCGKPPPLLLLPPSLPPLRASERACSRAPAERCGGDCRSPLVLPRVALLLEEEGIRVGNMSVSLS